MGIVHMVRANINRSGKYKDGFDLKVVAKNLCHNSIILLFEIKFLVAHYSDLSGCLVAFCSKILWGGRELWIVVLLINEWGGGWGGMDTQPLQDDKKLNFAN